MKKKNKTKTTFIIIFYLILAGVIIYLLTTGKDDLKDLLEKNNQDNNSVKILEKLNYSKETITLFKEENLTDEIASKNTYSKTLEVAINDPSFDKEKLDYYLNIDYKDYQDFLTYLNTFIDKGYQANEINLFFNKLNEEHLQTVSNNSYNKDLASYLDFSYFKEDYLKRYLDYQKNNQDKTNEEIVTYVNIGLDYDYYTNVSDLNEEEAHSLNAIVNKYHKLPENFVPKNLTSLGKEYTKWGNNLKMVDVAAEAFKKMADDAKKENLYILASSTYRSIADQAYIYNSYVKEDGVAKADTYSARSRYSEHHTGLAVDYATRERDYNKIEGSKEDIWVRENAHKYGFILRYPKEKVFITGYKYEPWHLRYLGTELATNLYENNLTYEEYLARL